MIESGITLPALRQMVAAREKTRSAAAPRHAPLGVDSIDTRIGGGIAIARLHELFAAEPDDASSASGFAAMLALRIASSTGAIIWLRQEEAARRSGRIDGAGLAELGLDPARLMLGILPDPDSLLRVAGEMTRCPEVATVVIETWRSPRGLDLTATRRLALAAERSGVTPILLRADAEPGPSAAQTRWSIRSAPASPLEANAPGHPALDIHLLRQRGGAADARWQVEWDREQRLFRETAPQPAALPSRSPAVPGAVVPLVAGRAAGTGRLRAVG